MYIELKNPITNDTHRIDGVKQIIFHTSNGDKICKDASLFDVSNYTSVTVVTTNAEKTFNSDYYITKLQQHRVQ